MVSYSANEAERRLNGPFTAGSAREIYPFGMFDFLKYEFGYSWFIAYGHLVPLVLAVALGVVAARRRWPRWVTVVAGVVALWAIAGLVVTHLVGINEPMELPTARFLSSGSGRVLDVGAGSGRAAVGVLLARPKATVVGLDIYKGYWGIEGNTPERFMTNARIAGAADRAEARTGDMRDMPFEDGEFDAVISAYAIDHLRREGTAKALSEISRVLKPRGEFLLMIVNADWLMRIASPHAIGHHPPADPARWRALLEQAGFVVEEQGTRPATLYFLARKAS
jgi:arsenite methyltransferase